MRTPPLIVGVATVMLCVAGVGAACSDAPSADCQQAERALHPWANTLPDVHRTLPRDIDFPRGEREEEPDYAAAGANEAQAAKDIRTQAEPVKSPTLRANLNEVATGFDLISQSRLKPSVPTAPSKGYFAGTNRMNAALHDIKQECPDVGEEAPPPVTP
ncbi:MAG: hypothetical protein QOI25_5357 [Mycobacterium sp.]|nr:hypothetical protein [Mycobacterium sp.]